MFALFLIASDSVNFESSWGFFLRTYILICLYFNSIQLCLRFAQIFCWKVCIQTTKKVEFECFDLDNRILNDLSYSILFF
jgi:hypothetical protein